MNNEKDFNRFSEFHAGHFLRDLLQEEGHDTAWLANHTGCDASFVEALLEQPNMDAHLFIRMGKPLEPLFLQRMDEIIFEKAN